MSKFSSGRIEKPYFIIVYGVQGVGKTQFASYAEDPYFIDIEGGSYDFDVERDAEHETLDEVRRDIEKAGKTKAKTIVIDSLDWLEQLTFKAVCTRWGKSTIELAAGGYGKGYGEAEAETKEIFRLINQLRHSGKQIIGTAHSKVIDFHDPQLQLNYQRYELNMHKRITPHWTQYADAVFFACWERIETDQNKVVGNGNRIICPTWAPTHDAKNRFGIVADNFPLDYQAFKDAKLNKVALTPEMIRKRINELLPFVDEKTAKIAAEFSESTKDISLLLGTELKLKTIIKGKQDEQQNSGEA